MIRHIRLAARAQRNGRRADAQAVVAVRGVDEQRVGLDKGVRQRAGMDVHLRIRREPLPVAPDDAARKARLVVPRHDGALPVDLRPVAQPAVFVAVRDVADERAVADDGRILHVKARSRAFGRIVPDQRTDELAPGHVHAGARREVPVRANVLDAVRLNPATVHRSAREMDVAVGRDGRAVVKPAADRVASRLAEGKALIRVKAVARAVADLNRADDPAAVRDKAVVLVSFVGTPVDAHVGEKPPDDLGQHAVATVVVLAQRKLEIDNRHAVENRLLVIQQGHLRRPVDRRPGEDGRAHPFARETDGAVERNRGDRLVQALHVADCIVGRLRGGIGRRAKRPVGRQAVAVGVLRGIGRLDIIRRAEASDERQALRDVRDDDRRLEPALAVRRRAEPGIELLAGLRRSRERDRSATCDRL